MTPESTPMIAVDDIIAGKYRVERILGQGAMGMVVAAMHTKLQERRAIKFMLPSALGDASGVERFLREARSCAKLKSKHITTVYDVDVLDNGAPYIIMEYLEGRDLKEVLAQQRVLPVPVAVEYLMQALEAIGEAHQAQIVHRDLKPANMFLTVGVGGAPCLKILDFGIAKVTAAGAGPEQNEMTKTEMIMGSPLYMSPEQMKSSRYVDGRSDLWAVGVILYRMVTGVLPFNAATQAELFAIVLKDNAPPPSLFNPNLPPGLEAVILKCLAKDPANRFKNAGELALALRPYLNPSPNPQDAEAAPYVWRGSMPSIPEVRLSDSGDAHRPSATSQPGESIAGSTQVMPHSQRTNQDTAQEMAQSGTALMDSGRNPAISAAPVSAPSLGVSVSPTSTTGTSLLSSSSASNPPAPRASSPSGPGGQTGTTMSETVVQSPPAAGGSRTLAIGIASAGALFFAGVLLFVLTSRGGAPTAIVPPTNVVPSSSAIVQPTTPPVVVTPSAPLPPDTQSPPPAVAASTFAQTKPPAATAAAPTSTTTVSPIKTGGTSTAKPGSTGSQAGPAATATNTKKPDDDPFRRRTQ